MKKKLFGLGKGLSSLIPEKEEISNGESQPRESVFYVEIGKIKPNPGQPRRNFDKDSLSELADSIKRYGILQPLLVTKIEKPTTHGLNVEYTILAGERRWRAARLANVPRVPVIVKDSIIKDRAKLEVSLIENLQREDLNPLEEALAYRRFVDDFDMTHKEIAQKVSKSRESVANTLRILDLPADMQESIRAGRLSKTQARTLLAFKNDKEGQIKVYKDILAGKMSVRDIERRAKEARISPVSTSDRKFVDLEENLTRVLGTPVSIVSGAKGGRITIRFTNLEDLNKIAKIVLD